MTNAIISGGSYSVEIETTGVAHGLDKQLIIIPIPNKQQGDTITFLVDLQRCKEAVTITGWLLDTATASGLSKKKQFLYMMRKHNSKLTLKWGAGGGSDEDDGETISGSIQKVDIKEEPGRLTDTAGTLGTEIKRYSVQLVFVRGTIKS